jgi:hypothetical protein
MSYRLPLIALMLALSGCGGTLQAVKAECPAIPPPPPEIMEPVRADYLQRVKEWLYE